MDYIQIIHDILILLQLIVGFYFDADRQSSSLTEEKHLKESWNI